LQYGAGAADNGRCQSESSFMPRYVALIPAAGAGSRFGYERPKQYMDLLGKPMLAHSIETLSRHPRISAVSVVIAPGDSWFQQLKTTGCWCTMRRVPVFPSSSLTA
jgi:2-C-methyl-D-erythritol 4-phosphate cytidylyltransferase